jgi:hypothetical protein
MRQIQPAETPSWTSRSLGALGVLLALALVPLAAEAQVVLNGSGAMTYSYQFLGTQTPSSTGNMYALGVPGQYNFSDTFNSPESTVIATSPVGPYTILDSFGFTVGADAQGDVLTATLNLANVFNFANLQLRLYQVTSSSVVPVVPGIPAGSTMIQPWIGTTVSNPNEVIASFSGLQNNATYFLDIAGIPNGTNGGSYTGILNLAPVPLPPNSWLLISGLGVIGVLIRRRRAAGS